MKVGVCGCPRSGTTAMACLLSMNNIFVSDELMAFTKWYNKLKPNCGFLKRITGGNNLKRLINLGIDPEKLREDNSNCTVGQLYAYILHKGNDVLMIGDKVPEGYLNTLPALLKEFKDLKMIIILRDGRCVIESQIRKWHAGNIKSGGNRAIVKGHWPQPDVAHAQSMWLNNVKILERTINNVDKSKILVVKHENLVSDTKNTLEKISSFLGLNFIIENKDINRKGNIEPYIQLNHRIELWKENVPSMMDELSNEFKNYLKKYNYL